MVRSPIGKASQIGPGPALTRHRTRVSSSSLLDPLRRALDKAARVKTVLVIFGTRPEAIKMAPVIAELGRQRRRARTIVCVTSQHRRMLDQVMKLFRLRSAIDLNLMEEDQRLESLSARALVRVAQVLERTRPDLVLVQGDTTTAMIAALAAFYRRIPVGHVEAGLRTRDRYRPFPEEVNRRIITTLASYHFAPTRWAVRNLVAEGVPRSTIFLTGNTVVDALRMILRRKPRTRLAYPTEPGRRLVLVTAHRRESFGAPLENICRGLRELVERHPDIEMVYPVHLNPNVRRSVYDLLARHPRIHLIDPVDYETLVRLMARCYLILTDSGGIQEEAPVLGKPVLVLRSKTERPEAIEAGTARLVGTEPARILREAGRLLRDRRAYLKMARASSPFGDGHAARRIVRVILGRR